MKIWALLIGISFSVVGSAKTKALIHSASNIERGKVVLELITAEESPRALKRVDLRTHAVEALPWPAKVENEEVIGLIQLSDSVLLVSQWTSGDPKFPRVFRYFFGKEQWTFLGELPCLSFDKIRVNRDGLSVDCEANPLSSVGGSVRVLRTPLPATNLMLTLPVSEGRQGKLSFKLVGKMFKWSGLVNSEGKTIKAEDLL